MPATTGPAAPWAGSFTVETDGVVQPDGHIVLTQSRSKKFVLGSTVRYTGPKTGLEEQGLGDDVLEDIRTVTPTHLAPETDLASVPGPLRWFVNSYGLHTPAALIHDRLIPTDTSQHPGMTDPYADRFFRFMLEDLGYPWLKRWLMWTAVAFRTFYVTRRWIAILWVALSLAAIVAFAVTLLSSGSIVILALLAVAPLVAAALWKKQYGAGLVAAYTAPITLIPAVVVAIGYGVYWVAERVGMLVFPGRSPSG